MLLENDYLIWFEYVDIGILIKLITTTWFEYVDLYILINPFTPNSGNGISTLRTVLPEAASSPESDGLTMFMMLTDINNDTFHEESCLYKIKTFPSITK